MSLKSKGEKREIKKRIKYLPFSKIINKDLMTIIVLHD